MGDVLPREQRQGKTSSRVGASGHAGYNRRHKKTPGGTSVPRRPAQDKPVSRARAMRLAAALLLPGTLLFFAAGANAAPVEPPALAGIPIDFILFAATLVGIALFHHHTLPIAVGGLGIISLWKIGF